MASSPCVSGRTKGHLLPWTATLVSETTGSIFKSYGRLGSGCSDIPDLFTVSSLHAFNGSAES